MLVSIAVLFQAIPPCRDMNFIALLREQTLVRDLGGIVDQVSMLTMQCERATQACFFEICLLMHFDSAVMWCTSSRCCLLWAGSRGGMPFSHHGVAFGQKFLMSNY